MHRFDSGLRLPKTFCGKMFGRSFLPKKWFSHAIECSGGGIGIHERLKISCRKACGFKSRPEHYRKKRPLWTFFSIVLGRRHLRASVRDLKTLVMFWLCKTNKVYRPRRGRVPMHSTKSLRLLQLLINWQSWVLSKNTCLRSCLCRSIAKRLR